MIIPLDIKELKLELREVIPTLAISSMMARSLQECDTVSIQRHYVLLLKKISKKRDTRSI